MVSERNFCKNVLFFSGILLIYFFKILDITIPKTTNTNMVTIYKIMDNMLLEMPKKFI